MISDKAGRSHDNDNMANVVRPDYILLLHTFIIENIFFRVIVQNKYQESMSFRTQPKFPTNDTLYTMHL